MGVRNAFLIRPKNRLMQMAAGGVLCLGLFLHTYLVGTSGIDIPYVFRIRPPFHP